MKIYTIFTKNGKVELPMPDTKVAQAESIMRNPLGELVDKLREMNDLSNKLTKAQFDEQVANSVEKVTFKDVDGKDITLLKGGPGSGCTGTECGRPSTGASETKEQYMERLRTVKNPNNPFYEKPTPESVSDAVDRVNEKENQNVRTSRESHGSEYVRYSVPYKHREAATSYVGSDKFHADVAQHEADIDNEVKDKGTARGKRAEARAIDNFLKPRMSKSDIVDLERACLWNLQKGGPGSGCQGANCGRPNEGGSEDKGHYVTARGKETYHPDKASADEAVRQENTRQQAENNYTEITQRPATEQDNSSAEEPKDLSPDASELHIYADNHGELYRTMRTPIEQNLSDKYKKGTYDHEKAKIGWKYLADEAGKRYAKEYADKNYSFSPSVRREVASRLADDWLAEMKAGNFHERPVKNNLTAFAEKNPDQWHSHATDAKTLKELKDAKSKGLVEHSPETKQFRYVKPKKK